jgi:hypothetical protein
VGEGWVKAFMAHRGASTIHHWPLTATRCCLFFLSVFSSLFLLPLLCRYTVRSSAHMSVLWCFVRVLVLQPTEEGELAQVARVLRCSIVCLISNLSSLLLSYLLFY